MNLDEEYSLLGGYCVAPELNQYPHANHWSVIWDPTVTQLCASFTLKR